MNLETSYKSAEVVEFIAERSYQIEYTPHAGGIAEHTVGHVTGKTHTSMMERIWCWAIFKAIQDSTKSRLMNRRILG